ncbi:putative siderophore iron transporter mirb protein [Hirsutella rhossiliensis]|uniref:Siderophore iron transporter mirb protein n=1 Tax=Hirsutella rhossiliensis TaxID=111463 RepID=A0A9P8SL55_9HYPO|nr:putative siderophore iron transporter mirb protein [Hirsutella rhossiliensis]KAH0964791.1 putative siderophore iron transporter mirb protein [Hirsutella rhossiliensis]
MGACCLSFTYQVTYYCWNVYFTSYLQVVYNISITSVGYISSIFDVVSGVELLIVGCLIPGRYKWVLMWGSLGYVVICQIFIALGGGVIIIGEQVAAMAACLHDDEAAVLALLGLFCYIGVPIGNSISGAIWTNSLKISYPIGSDVRDSIISAYASTQRLMLIADTSIMVLALVFMMMIKDINVKKIQWVKGMVL